MRRDTGLGRSSPRRAGRAAPRQPVIKRLRSRQQLPAPLGSQQTQRETLTCYSTSALARPGSSPEVSLAAQHPLAATPSALQNPVQTAQGLLDSRAAEEGISRTGTTPRFALSCSKLVHGPGRDGRRWDPLIPPVPIHLLQQGRCSGCLAVAWLSSQ